RRRGGVRRPGGATPPDTVARALLSRDGHGLAAPVIDHLANRYGSRLAEILELVAADRSLGDPIIPSLPDLRAEVVEAVEREGALTLEDVLRRRTQIALRHEAAGAPAAGAVPA